MANWCSTRLTISHENEKELEKLSKLITKWTSKDYEKNGFGHDWLGNIVLGAKIGTVDEHKDTDLRCRGSIGDIYCDGNQLFINTETAWVPILQMWKKLLDKYLPDAELLYEANECGCGLYCTNDPCMKGRYIIDTWGNIEGIEKDYDASEETVREVLQKVLNTTETDIDALLTMFEKSPVSEDMSVHKWEFSDIDEWD